jgi:hypothetical protein
LSWYLYYIRWHSDSFKQLVRLPYIPFDDSVIRVQSVAQDVAEAVAQGVAQSVAQVVAHNFAQEHVIFPDIVQQSG